MTKLVSPLDRLRDRRTTETASIADDAARTATVRATLRDSRGEVAHVRVDPTRRICLPMFKPQ